MKKGFSIFIVLFMWAGLLMAQPAFIGDEAWKQLSRNERREVRAQVRAIQAERAVRAYDSSVDFFIPVEESIFLPAPAGIMAEGNWSRAFLEVPENEEAARKLFKGKALIFVLDTGEADHDEVKKYMLPGTSINYTNDASVVDGHNHSTHVAGSILATVGGVKYGVNAIGAIEDRIKLVFYKVCTNSGACSYASIQAAIEKATQEAPKYKAQGYRVFMNLSLGGGFSAQVDEALKKAKAAGIIAFAAAGNNGQAKVSFPGSSQHTLGIGAVGRDGARASFSNYGPEVFLAAPGVSVPSTCKGNAVCILSGTSMATPQALGMAAYLALTQPGWTDEQLLDFAARQAADLGAPGYDQETGWGAPKLGKYLDQGGAPPPPPPPPPPPTDEFPGRYVQFEVANPGLIAYTASRPPGGRSSSWLSAHPFSVDNTGRIVMASAEGLPGIEASRQFPVTKLVFWAPAEKPFLPSYDTAHKMAAQFFRNRGFGIASPADDWRAAQVAGYFFELVNEMFEEYPARVLRIECMTPEGKPLVLDGADLWHWRRAPER